MACVETPYGCDKTRYQIIFQRDINDPRHHRLLRMQLAVYITGDSGRPILFGPPLCCPDPSNGSNVGWFRLSIANDAHGKTSEPNQMRQTAAAAPQNNRNNILI